MSEVLDGRVRVAHASPTRRSFLKWSGVATGAATLLATTSDLGMPSTASAVTGDGMAGVDKVVWNSCLVNCGSRCALRFQVKDGRIVRELPDNTGTDTLVEPTLRPCVRGRSLRRRVYNPDRIKKPLRRKAGTKRGDGQWDEISWDEATDYIASEYRRIVSENGQEAVYYQYGSGVTGGNITANAWRRLLGIAGGYLGSYGSYSNAQLTFAMPFMYGQRFESNSIADSQHSKLVVYWGNNPMETRMSGGNNMWNAVKTRSEYGVRTIVIDPRYSDTAMACADQWIPIRPGSDAALVAAIAWVLLDEDLHDQAFLDKYCVGFDEEHMPEDAPENASYRSYIEGKGSDGVEKTPEWAAEITGIPSETIIALAREIGTAKPCSILQGWGGQRQANGEYNFLSVLILPLMTGNVGIQGGGNGSREGTIKFPLVKLPAENPIETSIPCFKWSEAIDHGAELTALKDGVQGRDRLTTPIKLLFNVAGNTTMNQHSDLNWTREVLRDESKCELIVAVDNHMCASAQYADLVLPATTNAEENDFIASEYAGDTAYSIIVDKAVDPLYEAKSHYDMCTLLAQKLGIEEEFTEGRTQEEWRTHLIDETRKDVPELWSEEEFHSKGVFRIVNPDGTFVANKDYIEDPEANPLETPSGKIEIYSSTLAEMAQNWEFPDAEPGDKIVPIPEFVETWEGPVAARDSKDFPLQMIGHHFKGRTHSTYDSVDWTSEAHPQKVWINPADSERRKIETDDEIFVTSPRGRIRTHAFVTPRIMPGVISIPQGAWYRLEGEIDEGGCVNTLTKVHGTPLSKGNPQHTNLVEVTKP
ncbi:DMSO/selenate family reductase complex A subunit [Actinomycetaceae bacterium L2_0104]